MSTISVDPLNSTSGFMTSFTLRPARRPASVDSRPDDRSRGLPRAVGWSLSLAFAAFILVAPAPVNAADPDGGTSLLGGLTGGLGGIVEPVTETVAPVTEIVDAVTDPVVEPVEPLVEPVAEPVAEPMTELLEPIVEPIVEPLVQPASDLVQPVSAVVESAEGLVEPVVEPIVEPVIEMVEPVTEAVDAVVAPVDGITSEPSTSEPSGDGGGARVELWVPGPAAQTPIPHPPTDNTMPVLTPGVPPVVPDIPSPLFQLAPTSDRNASVFEDLGPWVRTPQAMDAGPSASTSTVSSLEAPWWTRIAPIGAFGGLGSGQALSGVSIAIAIGLGLLLLFLVPPPFGVSRLQLAAVFWRPQAFVGPLERPG